MTSLLIICDASDSDWQLSPVQRLLSDSSESRQSPSRGKLIIDSPQASQSEKTKVL